MERSLLRQALYEAADLPDRAARPGCLREAERAVTAAHAEAVAAPTAQHRMRFDDIDIVGFHGQTVLHRPEKTDGPDRRRAAPCQADPHSGHARLPRRRRRCRRVGRALRAGLSPRARPIAGAGRGRPSWSISAGVANITYIDGDTLIACDTGPGNALIDDHMFRWLNQRFDNEGRTAAQGRVDAAWINRALQRPFFSLPPPKSLDRNDFAGAEARRHTARGWRGDADRRLPPPPSPG